jgi:hypothetical protein
MRHLLSFVELLCGADARGRVFEPLVADWQREWSHAPHSSAARMRIAVSGSAALAIALIACLVTGSFSMPRSAFIKGLLTLALSSLALIALQVAILSPQLNTTWIVELRIWMGLSRSLTFMIPLAILPTMMLWRELGLSSRTAMISVIGASVLTVLITGWLVPKTQGEPPFSDYWQEAMHQRAVEQDRAARHTYPGSAVRALRPTTPEQRAEQRRKWRTDPRYIAAQASQTQARWNSRTFMMGALTVALGALGWALGALGRTRPVHAVAWWALTWLALTFLDGQFVYWINTATMRAVRAASWVPLALFGTAAIVMLLAARKTEDLNS